MRRRPIAREIDDSCRYELHLLTRTASAAPLGDGHRFRTEETLDTRERAHDALVGSAAAAPEPELPARRGRQLVGYEADERDACSRPVDGGAVQPTIELPAHPIGDDAGGEVIEAPQPFEALAVVGLGDDQQACAHMAARRQIGVQLTRQRSSDERGGVDAFRGFVEYGLHCEVRRRRTRRGRTLVESGGETMCDGPVVAEPREHVVGRERGEIAERAQTEAVQHVDELGTIERGQGPRCEERGAHPSRDDHRGVVGGESRGKRPVGHAHVHVAAIGEHFAGERVGSSRQCVVATEVARRAVCRERAPTGLAHFDARCELVDGGDHRLEHPGVTRRIVFEHDELGAPPLRFATAHVRRDAFEARRRRAGHDAVGEEHRRRFGQRHARGDHRPVGTAHDEGADSGHAVMRSCSHASCGAQRSDGGELVDGCDATTDRRQPQLDLARPGRASAATGFDADAS